MDTFLHTNEIARCLGMSLRETEKLLRRSPLRSRMVGGRRMYLRDELLPWLQDEFDSLTVEMLRDMDMAGASTTGMSHDDLFITELLSPGRIHLDVHANTASSMIRKLAEYACRTGCLYDHDELVEQIAAREDVGSTALDNGVAFPHPRNIRRVYSEGCLLMLARAAHGIPFGGPKGRLTSLFFLLFFPRPDMHLHILARLSRMIRNSEFLDSLLDTETEAEALSLIELRERELLEEH
jgi:mannitol/fructose-specific phosphotransferase system IIA component (Ntr-type)